MQAGVLKDIVLDFLIGSLALGGRHVHVVQVEADTDVVVRALLGQRNDRLEAAATPTVNRDFTCDATTWGTAFGGTGNYQPE